jgi:hypothetical protein
MIGLSPILYYPLLFSFSSHFPLLSFFFPVGEGGTWKIVESERSGRRRAYSLPALDPEHLGEAHINPLFEDDDIDFTASGLPLHTEVSSRVVTPRTWK